jgi:hypothetical protein
MDGDYRITVKGVMSERFCLGFPGLRRQVVDGHTLLEGGGAAGRPVTEVLTVLGNLGLQVVEVRATGAPTAHGED